MAAEVPALEEALRLLQELPAVIADIDELVADQTDRLARLEGWPEAAPADPAAQRAAASPAAASPAAAQHTTLRLGDAGADASTSGRDGSAAPASPGLGAGSRALSASPLVDAGGAPRGLSPSPVPAALQGGSPLVAVSPLPGAPAPASRDSLASEFSRPSMGSAGNENVSAAALLPAPPPRAPPPAAPSAPPGRPLPRDPRGPPAPPQFVVPDLTTLGISAASLAMIHGRAGGSPSFHRGASPLSPPPRVRAPAGLAPSPAPAAASPNTPPMPAGFASRPAALALPGDGASPGGVDGTPAMPRQPLTPTTANIMNRMVAQSALKAPPQSAVKSVKRAGGYSSAAKPTPHRGATAKALLSGFDAIDENADPGAGLFGSRGAFGGADPGSRGGYQRARGAVSHTPGRSKGTGRAQAGSSPPPFRF